VSRLKYLGKGLALAPTTLLRMIQKIDPSVYDQKLAPDRFSLREVIAHLADLEPVIQGRMELALSAPGTEIANWDEEAEALAKNYAVWDVQPSLEQFSRARTKTAEFYESLTDEQTLATVKHPVLGELSVFDLAVFALGHDAYHFEQISQYM